MTTEQFPDAEPIEFRTLEAFPGYRFGSDGSVWSCLARSGSCAYVETESWRKKTLTTSSRGYLIVTLRDSGGIIRRCCIVHRLILEAFVGPCPPGMEGCHNDGNRSNCALFNLRWDTRKANHYDKTIHGTMPVGAKHPRPAARVTQEQVLAIRAAHSHGTPQVALAKAYGIGPQAINAIIKRRSWQWI